MKRYADFRILIVDDNQNNLFTLRTLIEKHMDVEVLEADSGQAALDIALGDYANWGDAERIAVNVDSLYREYRGDGVVTPVLGLFALMADTRDAMRK